MIKQFRLISLPETIDAPLSRYTSFDRLSDLLENRSLYFRRADLYKDSLEGTMSRSTLLQRPSFFEGATDHWIYETMPLIDGQTRKCVYVNCWHNSESESLQMWENYTIKNKGVMIKSSLNKIRMSIIDTQTEFLINPVQYINYEKGHISDTNSFYAFFHKDKSFEYEREVRFALIKNFKKIGTKNFDKLNLKKGILVLVNIDTLIEKIIISPYARDELVKKTSNLLKKYNLADKLESSSLKI